MASGTHKSGGDGLQGNGHCRPVAVFLVSPVINGPVQAKDLHPSASIALVSLDLPTSHSLTTVSRVAELNTGPPQSNLIVALHRLVI